ncbi:MAG: hypothetical protein ACKOHG_02390, partial [Planctomycetia bacterium]
MLTRPAGVSKKVGLPGFSSASASCAIEAELDSNLLQDHEGFQVVVQRAYQSCEKAVQDQIARLMHDTTDEPNQPQPQEVIEVRHKAANWVGPGSSSRGSRVVHQPEDRCGSAIDRAIRSWAKLIARIAEAFPLACPACGGPTPGQRSPVTIESLAELPLTVLSF